MAHLNTIIGLYDVIRERSRAGCTVLVLSVFLSGCATSGANLGSRLIGKWETQLAGFTLTTTYTETGVSIAGQPPQPYVLEGNLLIVNGDDTTAREVSFTSRNEMQQIDAITGTVHVYSRLP